MLSGWHYWQYQLHRKALCHLVGWGLAGWIKLPIETTISRLFKEVTERQISLLEAVNHKLRGRVWKQTQRAGVSKVGLSQVQWVDIDATIDSVCDTQD